MGLFKADRIVINPAPTANPPPTCSPPPPPPPPQSSVPVIIQQQPEQGIWTLNGKRYMSALLATSYLSGKLITPTGQAHLLSGATDAQLIDDYRNGDVTSAVLTLFAIPVPKGLIQIKQSPALQSPEFPDLQAAQNPPLVTRPSGSWTFTVPQGWWYTLDATAPTLNGPQPAPVGTPRNILFAIDSVRTTRTQRSDGGWDVTVHGEWTEVVPANQAVALVPAGAYSAVVLATLYPADNPPPSV